MVFILFHLDFHTQLSETLKDRQTGWQQLAETKNSLIRKIFILFHTVFPISFVSKLFQLFQLFQVFMEHLLHKYQE